MTGVEPLAPLTEEECWERVTRRRLGRLAVIVDGEPQVFPVNYAPDGRRLLFRSGPGTKLDASRDASVCFQVDDFDETTGAGWSVMLFGSIAELDQAAAPSTVSIHPAAPGRRPLLLAFTPRRVTGRRFGWGAVVAPFQR